MPTPTNDTLTYEQFRVELTTLSRDYHVSIAVLNDAIKSRTQQFYRDRAALLNKYSAVLWPGDVPGDVPVTASRRSDSTRSA